MSNPRLTLSLGLLLLMFAGGCRHAPTTHPADTGARKTVKSFYEALIRSDWPAAYELMHPDSRGTCTAAQFARLGDAYRQSLKFEPTEVQIRSCAEHGTEAVAHVVLVGHTGGQHRMKDGLNLKWHEGTWRVLLPTQFGTP